MTPQPSQTSTPLHLVNNPQKSALVAEFAGKHLPELRTPAFVIDRHVFSKNCERMHANAAGYGAAFRPHLKSHKTVEGTRLQLVSSFATTHAVVVSTLMEAWEVIRSELVMDGIVKDVLYGLPVATNKITDLSDLWDEAAKHEAIVRLLVDHPRQIEALEEFEKRRSTKRQWSVFVKLDGSQKRAGVVPGSQAFSELLKAIYTSSAISLYGFYCHAGNSYGSTGLSQASQFLSSEVQTTNEAAKLALDMISGWSGGKGEQPKFVLSVGSTPTAHSASAETREQLGSLLHGTLELHAGNYPILDLQQLNTGLVNSENIAHKVLTTVISYYPGRGADGTDEALCDAGAVALSEDKGPREGYGDVIGKPWRLGRIFEEHGILTCSRDRRPETLEVGSMVEIIGQHACLIATAHPWYYITDSSIGGDTVVDIWVPWKGCEWFPRLSRAADKADNSDAPCRLVTLKVATFLRRIAIQTMGDYSADATELVETYDFLMKYIIIGEAGTGKSCLLHHFTHNTFKAHSQHTIGVEFSSRTVKLGEKRIKLQLWDTAGQERFRSVTRSYYRGAAGALLVYDITNRDSFMNLSRWLEDARALGSPHLVVVLVGNKSDKEEDREVEWEEASRWAAAHNVHFLETSSLTGDNVEAPFLLAARSVLLSIESGVLDPEKAGSGVSYGDRALRRVNSSSRLSFGSFGSFSGGRRRGSGKLRLRDWVPGAGRRCC